MILRCTITCLLILLSVLGHGQGRPAISLQNGQEDTILREGWVMANGDNPAWAARDFDDRNWPAAEPEMHDSSKSFKAFTGLAWFRLHIEQDSIAAQTPVALQMSHYGASRVYLDGTLLHRAEGLRDSATVFEKGDPRLQPYIINLTPGRHVLAVRYDYPDFKKDSKRYAIPLVGFTAKMGQATDLVADMQVMNLATTLAMAVLFTLFFTLAIIHLFHFAYHRRGRSNLMFSLFNLCIAYLSFCGYLNVVPFDSEFGLEISYWTVPVGVLAVVAFSGFNNELFGSRRRLLFIAVLGLITILSHFWFKRIYGYLFMPLVAIVALEGILLIGRAIIKKEKGARIIGAGMLLMASLVLVIVVVVFFYGLIGGSSESKKIVGVAGAIVIILLIIAVIIMPLSMSAFLAWNFGRINKDLNQQLAQVRLLSEQNLAQEQEKQRILASRGAELEREVAVRTEELRGQKQKSDDLLRNILPEQVAEELKENGKYEARLFEQVTVLFTDFVDFTQVAEKLSPAELIREIDDCFQAFDKIIERHGLEKIKTVGDAYIAVAGLPSPREDHAFAVIQAAMEIRAFTQDRINNGEGKFAIRIGVHSGSVVAGIVGLKKFAYDIWGDTVNTAARMEQHGEAGRINISSETYKLLGDVFLYTHRGALEVKHKGKLDMYFVEVPRVNVSEEKT